MSDEIKKETTETEESEKWCPACWGVDKKSKLHVVTGLPQMAENPAQLDGAPRVIECEQKCRFTLEPYFKRKKKVLFCYVCILSDTNPPATCNHHWVNPGYVDGWSPELAPKEDGYYSPLKKE